MGAPTDDGSTVPIFRGSVLLPYHIQLFKVSQKVAPDELVSVLNFIFCKAIVGVICSDDRQVCPHRQLFFGYPAIYCVTDLFS